MKDTGFSVLDKNISFSILSDKYIFDRKEEG